MKNSPERDAILRCLSEIPSGKVTTYGALAKAAGLGSASRYAGAVLRSLPEGSTLPWHRVINSQGRISLPEHHPAHNEQRIRLESEGIVFIKAKVDLKKFLYEG